jgi:hypothetical protein
MHFKISLFQCSLISTLASYWDKITSLCIYERIMDDWVPVYPIDTTQTNLLFLSLFSSPSTSMLFIPWSDDQGRYPRLAGWPRATRQRPCPDGGPSRARAMMVSLLVYLKTSWFFITQVRWLSIGGLLVNLFVLHCEKVTSSLRSSVHSGPGVQCPFWCVIRTTSTSTHFLAIPLGKYFLRLYFVVDSSCPSPNSHCSIFLCSPLPLHQIWFWPLVISFAILQ